MTDYKVLFLDIDGTILRPDHTIEASTKEAIKQVQEKGIDVFLATGRPLHDIWHIGEELNISSYIGYNGSYAIHKGEDVVVAPITGEVVRSFLDLIDRNDHEAILFTNNQNLLTSANSPFIQEFVEKFEFKKNAMFDQKYMDEILGITLLNLSEKDLEKYEQIGGIHLSAVHVEGLDVRSYDVIRDNVNKGFAVENVLNLLGINKEQAIAFGDGMNDKEMLQLVGEGFAMGNAHPDLLAYANRKTTDVKNAGIFNGLKALGLVE